MATRAFSLDARIDWGPVTSSKHPVAAALFGQAPSRPQTPLTSPWCIQQLWVPIERPWQRILVKENVLDALSPGGYTVFTTGTGAAVGDPGICPTCPLPVLLSGSV